jgi:molybdopterin/thiamine biosynthesis adenylyltransferase
LEENELFSTFNILICRTDSFEELRKYAQRCSLLDAPASKTAVTFLGEIHVFHNRAEEAYLEQKEPFST